MMARHILYYTFIKKGNISIKQIKINNNNLPKKNLMKDWDIQKKCLKIQVI